MGVAVHLTSDEWGLAIMVGVFRRMRAHKQSLKDRRGIEQGARWDFDIEGAAAEMAVARLLGVYWFGNGEAWMTMRDVGHVEVRHTRYPAGKLVLHPSDRDDTPYVLVTGDSPHLVVHGWCWGRMGKVPEYWGEQKGQPGRGAYWVPQQDLKPLSELPTR